jgi:penicillin-binding protein 1A
MNIRRPGGLGKNRARRTSSRFVTTSRGRQIRINRSLLGKWGARKEAKALRKAERLRGLPKSRVKRFFWRLHPKRLYAYWFSRDGGIMALKIVGIGIVVFFVLSVGVFAYFRKDLPDITDISGDNLGGSISYYDRSGKILLWQDYNAVKRVPVASEEISQHLKDATIATEDRNFYTEKGFNLRAIVRAAINNTFKKGGTQGGSTITQQLVKITQDWSEERTFTRKVKELILAIELERTYTKDEILTGYLNAAPYGGVDHGAQAAASDYFH